MTHTQEQINQNCVETNSSYAFKTTNPDCKETKLFDLVRSGTHTAFDLIAAERYDALEWYKARASYLEKRVAKLEEKYEKKDEDEDSDDDENEENSDDDEEGEDCAGYECGNKLTTELECSQLMCFDCINIWNGFEKDGVPMCERHTKGAAIYAAMRATSE